MAKYEQYAEYKDAGVEWLGEIPNHWEVVPIKHLAILNPKKSTLSQDLMSDECSFVPMEKLKFNSLVLDEKKVIKDVYDGYTYFENEDILVAKVTPCFENNNTTIAKDLINGVGFGSSEIFVLRVNNKVNNRYLFYRLLETIFISVATAAMTGAGGLRRVPAETINTYSIAVPNVDEQTQIAKFLNFETAQIDTLIEKQQILISLLKEKRQAVISHAVTKGLNADAPMKDSGVEWLGEVPEHWEYLKFDYVVNSVGDIDHYMPKSVDSGVPYLMTGDLKDLVSDIDFDRCKQVDHKSYIQLSRKTKTMKGNLILARYATIGTVSYVDIEKEFLVSYACVTIDPNTEIVLGKYLYWYLKSQAFADAIKRYINSNTQGNVGVDSLKRVKLVVPTLKEQESIITYIEDMTSRFDTLNKKAAQAIQLMQERRTALISAAVTGKIDVRGWQAPDNAI